MEYKRTPSKNANFIFDNSLPISIPAGINQNDNVQDSKNKYLSDLFYKFLISSSEEQPQMLHKIKCALDENRENIIVYFEPSHLSKLILLMGKPNLFDKSIEIFTDLLCLFSEITKNLIQFDFFSEIEQYLKLSDERCRKSLQAIICIFNNLDEPESYIQIRNAFYSSNCYHHLLHFIEEEQFLDETSEILYLMTIYPYYPIQFQENIIHLFIKFIHSTHVIPQINGTKGLNQLLIHGFDISSYVLLSPLSETCLLEDFTSFLTIPNEPLQISTLDFLCNLCSYKDEALSGMVYFRTITEVRHLIRSESTAIVGKALNFFLKWVLNTTEYYSLLLDEISDIDFVAICQRQPYSIKLIMTELLLRLTQNAIPYHLQKIVTEDFVLTMFDQLDVIGKEAARVLLDVIMGTAQK